MSFKEEVAEPLLQPSREHSSIQIQDDADSPQGDHSPVIHSSTVRSSFQIESDEAKSREVSFNGSSSSSSTPPPASQLNDRNKKKRNGPERFGIGGAPPPPDAPRNTRANFGRLMSLSKPERSTLVLATICLFLSSLLNLALPAIVAVIIDAISGTPSTEPGTDQKSQGALYKLLSMFGDAPRTLLNTATVFLLIIIFIANIFAVIRGYLFSLAGERIVARMRKQLFEKLVQCEIGFFDVTRTGELTNRLSSDSTILKDAATTNISMGLRWFATVIIGLGYLFVISWRLTLVMLSIVPVVTIGARYFGRKIRTLSKGTQDALAEATTTAEECISNMRTIRSFGKEKHSSNLYSDKIEVTFELGKSIAWQYGWFIGLVGFLAALAMIIVLYYGSVLVLNGDLTPGVLTAFVLYTLTVGMALAGLSGLFASFMQALGACERIFELLDRPQSLGVDLAHPQVFDRFVHHQHVQQPVLAVEPLSTSITVVTGGDSLGKIPAGKGEVRFENVFFQYPSRPENPVLKGLNLTLIPGTVTALVGVSGGGKTTVVSLLERFYDIDPSHGASSRITFDGVDLRDINLHWLHRHVGLVSQEPTLFCTSIRDNLLYGVDESIARSISDARLVQACEHANAYEFIRNFPQGFETLVGERGVRLSGGQRQRLAIARALLMDPILLIADEATSALDSDSEWKVQQALERLMAHRTTLVIAHRLSTVKNAQKVCVVNKGVIAEEGTHEQLLAKGGLYEKLVRRQLQQPDEANATISESIE